MGVGVFFELFWLDAFPAGTYVPPHAMAGALMALALCGLMSPAPALGAGQAGLALAPMALGVGCAEAFRRLEMWQRQWQNRAYDKLNARLERGEAPDSGRLLAASATQLAGLNLAAFYAAAYAGVLLAPRLGAKLSLLPGPGPVAGLAEGASGWAWGHLWFVAAIGGVLSLRLARAYGVLAAVAAFLCLALLAGKAG